MPPPIKPYDETPRGRAAAAATAAEKREERAVQFQLARYGLYGALLGAGIGIAGTFLITNRQIDAQADQAQRSFVLNQRQDAFTHMLQVDNDAKNFEVNVASRIDEPVNAAALKRHGNRALALLRQLNDANSVVMLSGGVRAVSASQRLKEVHTGYLGRLIIVLGQKRFDVDTYDNKSFRRQLEVDEEDVAEASGEYLVSIRTELGIDSIERQ